MLIFIIYCAFGNSIFLVFIKWFRNYCWKAWKCNYLCLIRSIWGVLINECQVYQLNFCLNFIGAWKHQNLLSQKSLFQIYIIIWLVRLCVCSNFLPPSHYQFFDPRVCDPYDKWQIVRTFLYIILAKKTLGTTKNHPVQILKIFVWTNTENLCPENILYCFPLPKGRAKAPEGGRFASISNDDNQYWSWYSSNKFITPGI